jgi:hypothetical protein
MEIAGTNISFGPSETSLGTVVMSGNWSKGGDVGLQIGSPSKPRLN